MKLYSQSYSFVRAILSMLIGLALIIWPDYAQKYLMTVIGSVVILFGIFSLLRSNIVKDKSTVVSFNGVFNIIFGIVIITSPIFFLSFLTIILGILLFLVGIGAMANAIMARRVSGVGVSVYLMPVLIMAAGAAMCFYPRETNESVFVFFGIVICLYGLSEIVTAVKVKRLTKESEYEDMSGKVTSDDGIEDAEIVEDDDVA